MEKEQIIANINGYLESLSLLNTFVNDQKTYEVVLLSKIDNDIQKTLNRYFEATEWTIELQDAKTDWQTTFLKDLKPYFDQIIVEVCNDFNIYKHYSINIKEPKDQEALSNKIRNSSNYNINQLLEVFIEKIESLLKDVAFVFKQVTVNWWISDEGFYECAANDYLFDLGEDIIFIHFGISD